MSFKSIFVVFSLLLCQFMYAEEVRIVYANKWYPYSYGDAENVKGILPGIVEELLVNKLNYTVRHIGVPWNRAQSMVRSGEADGFVTAATQERLSYSKSSSQILYRLKFQGFSLKNSSAQLTLRTDPEIQSESKTLKYCDVIGNGWAVEFYEKKQVLFHRVPTILNCLKMLQRKRQDVVIHSVDVVEAILAKEPSLKEISKSEHLYQEVAFQLLISNRSSQLFPLLNEVDAILKADL